MNSNLVRMVFSALCVGLIIVGAYISLPIGPVPVVLANMFAIFAGLLLGPIWGGIAVLVYLILGVIGLGVFAGGASGFAVILGPTGGFLIGYFIGAVAAGLITLSKKSNIVLLLIGSLAGFVIVYLVGLPWFNEVMNSVPAKADWLASQGGAFAYMVPYMLGDLAKMVVAAFLALALRPLIKGLTGQRASEA